MDELSTIQVVRPDWSVNTRVKAFVTTRRGGLSVKPYDSFNLATHVGDDLRVVMENRKKLKHHLELPAEPGWLEQVHGTEVTRNLDEQGSCADASYANQPGRVCVVLTADCLPVFFASKSGREVAVAHAGWKGLLNGVIENTLQSFEAEPNEIDAWLGPAIGPAKFEVGEEVLRAFVAKAGKHELATIEAFQELSSTKWLADIYTLAKIRLKAKGIENIGGGQYCTVTDEDLFYSYRRDGKTGRMASLIWIDQ